MNILSAEFLIFAVITGAVYFAVPKKVQWCVLLVASLLFYGLADGKNIAFILLTATITYFSARYIDKSLSEQKAYLKEHKSEMTKEERNAYKARCKRPRRLVMTVTLLVNFGLLCFFKYIHFIIEQLNALIFSFGSTGSGIVDAFSLLIPLGISFYTFQTMGYVLDVYWGKATSEKNYLKVVLFTSFFPQITQGPISNYNDLTGELFKEHSLTYRNFSWGAQRMIWGFFKKMVVANILSYYVSNVFLNHAEYSGATALVGAFMYSVQIYADFSGYMDIMCGLCEILDIRLTENFQRPYFSKSIAEYWRRWHISLCSWFKNYIYYPMAVAKWNQHLGRWTKTHIKGPIGKACGDYLPATIALIVVWVVTGLWHGASWAYIAWGACNGLFIIVSLWMERPFASMKRALHVNEASRIWQGFQVIRTFVLVTFIKVLPEVGTLDQGIGFWRHIFCDFSLPSEMGMLIPGVSVPGMTASPLWLVAIGTIIMFVVSMLQRKRPVRERFNTLKMPIRSLILGVLIVCIVSFGAMASWDAGSFMYANF